MIITDIMKRNVDEYIQGVCNAYFFIRKPYMEGELVIQCSGCQRWTHGVCEELTTEEHLEQAADKGKGFIVL